MKVEINHGFGVTTFVSAAKSQFTAENNINLVAHDFGDPIGEGVNWSTGGEGGREFGWYKLFRLHTSRTDSNGTIISYSGLWNKNQDKYMLYKLQIGTEPTTYGWIKISKSGTYFKSYGYITK